MTRESLCKIVLAVAAVGLAVALYACSEPEPVKIPPPPAKAPDVTPTITKTASDNAAAGKAVGDSGTTITTASAKITTATAAITTDMGTLTTKHPEIKPEPESASIPQHVADIDAANKVIAEQAKLLAAQSALILNQSAAFKSITDGVGAIRAEADANKARADAAVSAATAETKRADAAEKQLHDRDANLLRAIGWGIIGLGVAWGAFWILAMKDVPEAAWALAFFALGVVCLVAGEYFEWIKFTAVGVTVIGGGGYLCYKLGLFSKATNELIEVKEYLLSKFEPKAQAFLAGTESVVGRIEQKGLISASTQTIIDKAVNAGSVIVNAPLPTVTPVDPLAKAA